MNTIEERKIEQYYSHYAKFDEEINKNLGRPPILKALSHGSRPLIIFSIVCSLLAYGVDSVWIDSVNEPTGLASYLIFGTGGAFITIMILGFVASSLSRFGEPFVGISRSITSFLTFTFDWEDIDLGPEEMVEYWVYRLWSHRECDDEILITEGEKAVQYFEEYPFSLHGTMSDEKLEKFVSELPMYLEYNPDLICSETAELLKDRYESQTGERIYDGRVDLLEIEHDDEHIQRMLLELNSAYRYRIDSTVFMQARKLIEGLISRFYLKNFPEELAHIEEGSNRWKSLGSLQSQLETDLEELKAYSHHADNDLIESIECVRNMGNKYVHNSDAPQPEDDDFEKLKENVDDIFNRMGEIDRGLNLDDEW